MKFVLNKITLFWNNRSSIVIAVTKSPLDVIVISPSGYEFDIGMKNDIWIYVQHLVAENNYKTGLCAANLYNMYEHA